MALVDKKNNNHGLGHISMHCYVGKLFPVISMALTVNIISWRFEILQTSICFVSYFRL